MAEQLLHKLLFDSPQASGDCRVALLGAGGKTSFLYGLGRELSEIHSRILLSSLTKAVPHDEHPLLLLNPHTPDELEQAFSRSPVVTLLAPGDRPGKLCGLSDSELRQMAALSDCCIFENDGAAKHPLKIHNQRDPEIPAWSTHAVILVGAEVLNTQISDGFVHRHAFFCEHWGLTMDHTLDADLICQVLKSGTGYAQKNPAQIPVTYFVNKADRCPEEARELAEALACDCHAPVAWGSLQEGWYERVQ